MRLSLRRKILFGYGLVLLLLCLVLGWSLLTLRRLGDASAAILRENYRSILAAEAMINALERQDSAVLLGLLGQRELARQMARGEQVEFLQWLGRARDNITIAGEQAVIEAVDAGYREFLQRVAVLEERRDGSLDFYLTEVMPGFTAVRETCVKLRNLNQEVMFGASAKASAFARRGIWSEMAVGGAALGLGLLFSLFLATWLTRPLRELLGGVRRVAAGDLGVELPGHAGDELGQLTAEFNTMARQLQRYSELNVEQMLAEQEKNAAILRSIDDGLVVVDPELRLTNLNPAAAALLGVDRHEVRGRHLAEVLADEVVVALVRQTLAGGESARVAEELLTVAHQSAPRRCQVAINRFETPAGGQGVVVLLRDVTRLTELDELKSRFVMTASHELRTPLTSIGLAIALVRERSADRLSDRERELLAAADEDVGRLKALISDLLDLSRLEAGQLPLDLVDVSLEPVAESARSVLAPQYEAKGVDLVVEGGRPAPVVVADPTKLTWVLTNLLANALRYTPAGGRVTLGYRAAGTQALLLVRDTGAGIAPEAQARIFDKFVSGDRTTGGTGLGLAICREIVRAHGGTIWVESEPGEGSVFHVCLPLAERDERVPGDGHGATDRIDC